MATLKLKNGKGPLYLSASSIEGLRKDRHFTDNKMVFDDFTEAETDALLNSYRGGDFEQEPTDKAALLQRYKDVHGKDADKRWNDDRLIEEIDAVTPDPEEAEEVIEEEPVTEPVPVVVIEQVKTVGVIATVDDEQPKVVV